ncbi:MAG: 4Fe-4S binding protein [Clostridia bacterium]|nr:4Fe-4S binding protein [Clostridia bacterium]
MKKKIRKIVQVAFFVLVGLMAINHTLAESGKALPLIGSASIHAVCPFGSVAGLYQLVTTGTFVKKVQGASLIVLYLVLLLSLLFGPVFCGWMCPLGAIQEWFNALAKKLKIPQKKLPKSVDRLLRQLRYVVLIMVMVKTAQVGALAFNDIDPYYAIFNFWTDDFVVSSGYVLIVVLLVGLFVERAWCKYICPFGALLGITNKFRIFKIRRSKTTCINCKLCTANCPMDIVVHDQEVVSNAQCISCMKCTSEQSCPVDKTVQLEAFSKKPIQMMGIGVTIILVMVIGVSGAIASNHFPTETEKIPTKFEDGSGYDLDTIKGSYAFTDISEVFDIPLDVLGTAFGIPEAEWTTIKNKDLKERYGSEEGEAGEIGNGSVKMFISLYKNLPYDYETAGDYIPLKAFELLDAEGKIPEDKRNYIESHTVTLE